MAQYFALDMGGTYIKYALMNEKAEIIEQGKFPSVLDNAEKLLDAIEETAEKYTFEGIAVSMPGRIDTKNGIAHTSGKLHMPPGLPFAEMLENRLHVPVTLGNDGKCAAMAEVEDGALKDVSSGAVIVLGTGIGGGVVLNRKVWMGASGGAGEFSWMLRNFEKFVETPFSREAAQDLVWGFMTCTPGLLRMYAGRKGKDPSEYTGVSFFEAYDAGDPDAAAALDDLGRSAVAGIYAVQAVLDLECYAIGGGISARREVAETIARCLDEKYAEFPNVPFSKPRIVSCRYGNDANLIGALRFHLDRMR